MIVAQHLTKYYGEKAAISDLSFSIAQREVVGLLGLNGAGKTTTLKILSGLLLPTAGSVRVGDVDLLRDPETLRKRIGFLPETPPLYKEMNVGDFLRFVVHIKGINRDVSAFVDHALRATDLVDVREQRISTLSHGYQRRVGIAQAIVHKPDLILLDEPTSGLDPVQVVHMRQLIRDLHKHHTVIVSSHILSEIHQMCDRILVLQEGKIAAQGTEQELAMRVTKATSVVIEVRAPRVEVENVLKGLALVQHHRIDSEQQGVTSATVDLKNDARDELARAIVGANLGLLRLEKVQLELENIFLKLTEGHVSREPQ